MDICQGFNAFYNIRNTIPPVVVRSIYFAFVHPYIVYAIEVYGSAAMTYVDKLTKMNNKILRMLQF